MDYTIRDTKLKELGFADYDEYLRSDLWKKKRAMFLWKTTPPEVCAECRTLSWACALAYGKSVNVHHRTYDRLGDEDFADLEILCWRCHEIEHFGKSELPRIILRACHFCSHPKLTFDPPVDLLAIDDTGSVGRILQRMFASRSRAFRVVRRTAKLIEVMQHPTCFAESMKGMVAR